MDKSKIKALIFDLDGTLLDSLADIGRAMNKALFELGYPTHPIEKYAEFVGGGQSELVRRTLPQTELSEQIISDASQKFWDFYDLEWYLSTKPYIGILYMIQLAVARKIKLAILSNKPHYFTKKMIRHFFRGAMIRHTKNPFGIYSGEQQGYPKKPDPSLALELADRLKEAPQNIALVGDMPVDIQTAKNAGMISFGAGWGFSGKEQLKKAGADLIFETPIQLAAFLETIPLI